MKTISHSSAIPQSTYALLVRSEAEERSLLESAVYLFLILCTAFSVWQSAHQPFTLPAIGLMRSAPIAQNSDAQHQRV